MIFHDFKGFFNVFFNVFTFRTSLAQKKFNFFYFVPLNDQNFRYILDWGLRQVIHNLIQGHLDVPEVLNVHMNEIYKEPTTIKSKKLKFK